MAGSSICILCYADTCTSYVHPVFNPVAPYQYRLPTMYLFILTCLCVVVGHGFVLISPAFMRSSASHPVDPHAKKTGAHFRGAGGFNIICTAVCNRRDSYTACRLCRLEPPENVSNYIITRDTPKRHYSPGIAAL